MFIVCRWAQIAKHLPGRTDNEVKNFWNSAIKKKHISQNLFDQAPFSNLSSSNSNFPQYSEFNQVCIPTQPPSPVQGIDFGEFKADQLSHSAIMLTRSPSSAPACPLGYLPQFIDRQQQILRPEDYSIVSSDQYPFFATNKLLDQNPSTMLPVLPKVLESIAGSSNFPSERLYANDMQASSYDIEYIKPIMPACSTLSSSSMSQTSSSSSFSLSQLPCSGTMFVNPSLPPRWVP